MVEAHTPTDPASIVLADGHTTVKEAFDVANEMHDMVEEEANLCNDGLASALSKGAAIIEMLAARVGEYQRLLAACNQVLQQERSDTNKDIETTDQQCDHRGFEAVTMRMQREMQGNPDPCPWCEVERLRAALQSIAKDEDQAREAVSKGFHNTTFAIDLAGRARMALEQK